MHRWITYPTRTATLTLRATRVVATVGRRAGDTSLFLHMARCARHLLRAGERAAGISSALPSACSSTTPQLGL